MCTVSNMGDHYHNKWNEPLNQGYFANLAQVSRSEFEALKKEVEEMKQILKIAKDFDDKTNQPHCEQESKIETLKKVAEIFGVDLTEIFGK